MKYINVTDRSDMFLSTAGNQEDTNKFMFENVHQVPLKVTLYNKKRIEKLSRVHAKISREHVKVYIFILPKVPLEAPYIC